MPPVGEKGPDEGENVRPATRHPARGDPAGRPHPFPGVIGTGIAPGIDRGDWPNATNRPDESQEKEKADRIASVLPARKKLATNEGDWLFFWNSPILLA